MAIVVESSTLDSSVQDQSIAVGPESAAGHPEAVSDTLLKKEEEFFQYFGRLVSEWNPAFSADGEPRFVLADEIDMDGLDLKDPQRVRLRPVLDVLFEQGESGEPMDLGPLRQIVTALVQTSGRHTQHRYDPPVFGKHACAHGTPGACFCRYGFPHRCVQRCALRKMILEKGNREGSFNARFPRNDGLCCSLEAHLLLGNLGNIDWRPCLNLWAVVQYITKYATKAPKGSRRLGTVLREVVEEVCKFDTEDAHLDLLRRTLQKFYSRTLGDRDYGIFEAMHLGLGLPLVLPFMPIVSLNTYGTRKLKTARECQEQGEDEPVTHLSKVDLFDDRLAILRKRESTRRVPSIITEAELRDLSLYEFYYKYNVWRGNISVSQRRICLMVTPSFSADCANVAHARHNEYARMCVVAFWRLIATSHRETLRTDCGRASLVDVLVDERLRGGTCFERPLPHAGFPGRDRFLGVRDLVLKFDGRWDTALMELLVDPLMCAWVPDWVVEQYERQNPHFRESARFAVAIDSVDSNKKLLAKTKILMCARQEASLEAQARVDGPGGVDSDPGDAGSHPASDGDDVDPERIAAMAAEPIALHHDPLPSASSGETRGEMQDHWGGVTLGERVSAAGPSERLPDISPDESASRNVISTSADAMVNPQGYVWSSLVDRSENDRLVSCWSRFKRDVTSGAGDGVERDELDSWQKFAYDIVMYKQEQRTKLSDRTGEIAPLRMLMLGTAGTGKSRTIRSFVEALREQRKREGVSPSEFEQVVAMGAPTGCASFQMKYGASTIHRLLGISIGKYRPLTRDLNKRCVKVQQRLRRARLLLFDEWSMIGRQFLGKMKLRADELLGQHSQGFGGRDVVLSGDEKQAAPIADEPLYKVGVYDGKRREVKEDGVKSAAELSAVGQLTFKDFEDVVHLRQVHRVDDAPTSLTPEARREYAEEREEFWRVVGRMANCTWTPKEHSWLSRRNRRALQVTEAGRRQLAELDDAPILMDGKKQDSKGKDGAAEWNAKVLRQNAERTGHPILAIKAFHTNPEDVDPREWHADDFRGLASTLELSVAARVLLIKNELVEAGLMNGALGWVRGFMWPQGGDPRSEEKAKSAPICVIVEFDVLDLGVDSQGRRRTFFPDAPPDSAMHRWVPIYREDASCTTEEHILHRQFPLVLAWALTHWKAQGMNLPKVRICLGARAIAAAGVAFVASTRVRHPRHMVFDEDLPPWEDFQKLQHTAGFRMRQRFSLRMTARASHTLRKYGFCEANPWTSAESDVATEMLRGLKAVASLQRVRLQNTGRPTDEDAWLWPGGEPGEFSWFERMLHEQTVRIGGNHSQKLAMCRQVAFRLLHDGDGEYHMPAVREALGCLIPEALHPALDNRKPKGGVSAGDLGNLGVHLSAGRWQVDVSLENKLAAGPLRKHLAEFFLYVLRRVCAQLQLPMLVGSTQAGVVVGSHREQPQTVRRVVHAWRQWQADLVGQAHEFLLPVTLDGETHAMDWVFTSVTAEVQDQSLSAAGPRLRVKVADPRARPSVIESVGRSLYGLLKPQAAVVDMVDICKAPCPDCADSTESLLLCVGLIMHRVGEFAKEQVLDPSSNKYLRNVRCALLRAFAAFRAQADSTGERDVLQQLHNETTCKQFLRLVGEDVQPEEAVTTSSVVSAPGIAARGLQEPLKLLTWNIAVAAGNPSKDAPETWSIDDNVLAIQSEILRWRPAILALQECAIASPLERLVQYGYTLIGCSGPLHCGHVHLYVDRRLGLIMDHVEVANAAGVLGVMNRDGVRFSVVAVHLPPHAGEAERRKKQLLVLLRAIPCDVEAVLVLGDLDVREEEMSSLCKAVSLRNAEYFGMSWNPAVNRFHENVRSSIGPGMCFDRVLFRGHVVADVFLVGTSRVYSEGQGFFLSDHFALCGLLDLHASHGSTPLFGTANDTSRARRACLARLRDRAALSENVTSKERERIDRTNSVLQQELAAQHARGLVLQQSQARVKARNKGRRELWQQAFGAGSLFETSGFAAESLQSVQDVGILALEGLPSSGWKDTWCRVISSGYPRLAGFRCTGNVSYATTLCQVLLRLPAVAVYLEFHHRCCTSRRRCVLCSLHASSGQLCGVGLQRGGMPRFVEDRSFVDVRFRDSSEHSVLDFFELS